MRYLLVTILVLTIGCSSQEEILSEAEDANTSIFDYEMGLTISGPTLVITCAYDDCGEWGGHREEIRLVKSNQTSFCLEYQQYAVKCDSLTEIFDGLAFYYGFKQALVREENLTADNIIKKHVRNFASEMMRSKFEDEHYFSHAGVLTTIANRDSSFFIRTYTNSGDDFNLLKQQLGLE